MPFLRGMVALRFRKIQWLITLSYSFSTNSGVESLYTKVMERIIV